MSVGLRPEERNLLLFALGVLGVSAALGAAIGASRVGLFVPEQSSGSLADAATIFANNIKIWALLAAVAVFQPRGIPALSPGFLPLWLTDLTVAAIVFVNLVAIGGVLGALGVDALVRIAPHAPLELGAFGVVVVAYLRARRDQLARREAVQKLALACVLLLCGAVVESYVSGGLG
ncbi:MAG TPA: hypothetical protein VIE64_00460 [Solirubrobacterales bacterium]